MKRNAKKTSKNILSLLNQYKFKDSVPIKTSIAPNLTKKGLKSTDDFIEWIKWLFKIKSEFLIKKLEKILTLMHFLWSYHMVDDIVLRLFIPTVDLDWQFKTCLTS